MKDQLQADTSSRRRTQANGIGAEPVDSASLRRTGDAIDRIQPINGAGFNRIGAREIAGVTEPVVETKGKRKR